MGILYSKFIGNKLTYVENSDYKEYCRKNEKYKGLIWAIPHKTTQERTLTQNNSLHRGCELIAEALNDGGQDMRKVLKQDVDIPWTTESVKKHLFKPIMKSMTGKTSTKELGKVGEIDKIWDVLLRHLMQNKRLDEYIPFPHDPTKKYG